MDTDMLRDDLTGPADIPGLMAQAKAAYQQNRIRECLALTKAALLVDPGNTSALEMQSAVRFDMQRDLSDARALIEESRSKPEAQKYRKAAEIILLKALYLDPDSEGAKTLLSSIRSISDSPVATLLSSAAPIMSAAPAASIAFSAPAPPSVPPPAPPSVPPPAPRPVPPVPVVAERMMTPVATVKAEPPAAPITPAPPAAPIVVAKRVVHQQPVEFDEPVIPESPKEFAPAAVYESPMTYDEPEMSAPAAPRGETFVASTNVMEPEVSTLQPIPFTVGSSYIEKPGYMKSGKKKNGSSLAIPLTVIAIVVIGAALVLVRQKLSTNAAASTSSESSVKVQDQVSAKPNSYGATSAATASASNVAGTDKSAQAKPTLAAMNVPPSLPTVPAAAPVPVSPAKPSTAAVGPGSLAVSSPIAAEIYMGDKYLGSTPTTIQLPAGNQTIEYRHGDLRSYVTYVIRSRETTTALVTFDAIVQLNARPWATVSIEGSPRLPLGQTPLSDVRLPIGSVLVFENPNFPSKSHKIVADDKAIQMVFP